MAEQMYAEVSGSTSKVVTSLSALENHLQTLSTKFQAAAGSATTFSNAMQGIAASSKNANLSSLSRSISGIANASNKLQTAAPNIAPTLNSIASAINNMPAMNQGTIDTLSSLSKSFRSLGTSMKNVVANANQVGTALETIIIAANQLPALNAQATKTLTLLGNVAPVATKGAVAVKNIGSAAEVAGKKAKIGSSGFGTLISTLKRYLVIGLYIKLVYAFSNAIKNTFSNAADWTEQMNYFNVAFGNMAEKAGEYYTQISEVLGIDMSILVTNGAMFEAMSKSLGASSDAAYSLSTNLVAIGIDLASLTGKDLQETFDALQSGVIAGQYKSLAKNYGINVTEASIAQEALNLGIEESVENMQPLEKAYLRYKVVLRAASLAQGDMAKTLESPANLSRQFASSVMGLSRAVGNFLMPILVKIIPYVIAFTKVLATAFNTLAKLLGFEPVTFADTDSTADYTNAFDDLTDSTDAANSSVEELKKNIMGFDEFNILSENTSSSGSGSGSDSGSSFDMDWGDYDLLLDTANNAKVDEALKRISDALSPVKDKLGDLYDIVKKLKDPLKDLWENAIKPLGSFVLSTGVTILVDVLSVFLQWVADHPTTAGVLVLIGVGFWSVYKALKAIAGIKGILQILGLVKSGGTVTVAQTLTGGTLSVGTIMVAGAIVAATASYITDEDGAERYGSRVAEAWENMTQGNGTFTDSLVTNPLTGIGLGAFDFFDYIGAQVAGALDWREGRTTDWYQDQRIARNDRWSDNVDSVMSVSNISNNLAESSPLQLNTDALQKIPEGRNMVESPYSFVVTDNSGDTWKDINDHIGSLRATWEGTMSGMPSDIEDMLKKSGKLVEDGTKGWKGSMSGMPSALQDALTKSGKIVKTSVANTKTQYDGLTSSVTSSLTTIAQNAKDKVSSVVTSWQGMPSSIQAIMESTNSVISTKTAEGAAAASNSARIGKEGSANEYSSLKDRISEIFQGITDNITGQSEVGKNNLLTATSLGTSGTKEGYRNLVNKLNEYMAAMANNSATATKRTFQTLGGMPTSVQKYLGISWDGFKESAAISFPMFASGGFPEDGLFAANHGELVGKFSNGRTAVANNIQIVDGIRAGVTEGIRAVLSTKPTSQNGSDYETMYRAFRDVMKDIKFQPSPVVLDGEEVGECAIRVINKKTTSSGMSPLKA